MVVRTRHWASAPRIASPTAEAAIQGVVSNPLVESTQLGVQANRVAFSTSSRAMSSRTE